MAALNLTTLAPRVTPLPVSKRGRTAEPLPENIVKMVQESYTLPGEDGYTLTIPRGENDKNGNDSNVKALTAVLRRAATSLGHGLTISVGEGNKTSVPVTFRAKDKANRRTLDGMQEVWVERFESGEYDDVESVEDIDGWDKYGKREQKAILAAWEDVFTAAEDEGAEE